MHGVVGDGVTDNADALIALRNTLIADNRHRPTELFFRAGHYLYSNNRWIMGLTNLRVVGAPATLQCISTSKALYDSAPFPRDGMFSLQGDLQQARNSLEFVSGTRIADVVPGQREVVLIEKVVGKFAPGARVLVHGFSQQIGGYPPNLRYFEWARIAAVSLDGLVITLEKPLQREYSSSWPDFLYDDTPKEVQEPEVSYGASRILQLEDRQQRVGKYFYANFIELRDLKWLPNPNTTNALVIHALKQKYINLDLDDPQINLVVREGNECLVDSCTIGGTIELDKNLNECTIRNCIIRGGGTTHAIKAGTGVNRAIIHDNILEQRFNAITQECLQLNNNTISTMDIPDHSRWAAIEFYWSQTSGFKAVVENNLLLKRPNQKVVLLGKLEYTIIDMNALGDVVVDLSGGLPLLYKLRPGFEVQNSQGRVIGVVRAFGTDTISFDWIEQPAVGDTIVWDAVQTVIEIGAIDGQQH